jgi:hypothetical protein
LANEIEANLPRVYKTAFFLGASLSYWAIF